MGRDVWPGRPYPLGAAYDGIGTNFALFSEVAGFDLGPFFKAHIEGTEEPAWEVPTGKVHLYTEEGGWNPHIPVVRDIAIHYHLEVAQADGSVENFFLTHLGEPLEQLAQWKGHAARQ